MNLFAARSQFPGGLLSRYCRSIQCEIYEIPVTAKGRVMRIIDAESATRRCCLLNSVRVITVCRVIS
jgi:hypothetical protein